MKKTVFLEWMEQHRQTVRFISIPGIMVLMICVTYMVSKTGGVKFGYSHAMYIPVLLSGFILVTAEAYWQVCWQVCCWGHSCHWIC